VASNRWPATAVSEEIVSINRTTIEVPAGMVTLGGGNGAGAKNGSAARAVAGVTGGSETAACEGGSLAGISAGRAGAGGRFRGEIRFSLGPAGLASGGGAQTDSWFTTFFTPRSERAYCSAAARSASELTVPVSVTVPPCASAHISLDCKPESAENFSRKCREITPSSGAGSDGFLSQAAMNTSTAILTPMHANALVSLFMRTLLDMNPLALWDAGKNALCRQRHASSY
jgi:hypothetical protein